MSFLRTLRARLAALVLVSLLPIVVIFLIQADNARDRSTQDAQVDTVRFSLLSAAHLTAQIERARAVLDFAASRSPSATEACADRLSRLTAATTASNGAYAIGLDGWTTCSDAAEHQSVDLSDRAYVQDALTTDAFAVGLEPSGSLVPTTSLVAVLPAGTGLLGVSIDPGHELTVFVSDLGLPSGSVVAFVDFEGRLLASVPDRPLGEVIPVSSIIDDMAAVLVEGNAQADSWDGVERVYGYADVGGTGQFVYAIVGIPTEVAFAYAESELRTNLSALAVVASVGLVLALLAGELTVTRRVRGLLGAVRRLGAGDLSARTGMKRGGELGELARAFDDMAGDLQARDNSLRVAAEERERLLGELLTAQEEERRRIAADIHDDTIQTMIAAGLHASLLRNQLGEPELTMRARDLETAISHAVGRLRQLMFELEPAAIAEEGLEFSLEQYLASVLASEGRDGAVDLTVRADDVDELHFGQRQVLFRNVREAALNATRHGAAAHLDVDVQAADGGLLVRVSDDGRGFAPADARKPGHHGLRTMRERSEGLGGWLRLESAPDEGTTVTFWLP